MTNGDEAPWISVHIPTQTLQLHGPCHRSYPISTSAHGAGCLKESMRTPVGEHRIRIKIGWGRPLRAVFRGRRFTNQILTRDMQDASPAADWILTRILWLEGMEPGINRGGTVDTLRRYIYIHGTAQEQLLGRPVSHGCIRMANRGVSELFDLVAAGTRVVIQDAGPRDT